MDFVDLLLSSDYDVKWKAGQHVAEAAELYALVCLDRALTLIKEVV